MLSPLPKYSHIYIEESALAHPNTEQILQRFPRASVIEIKSFREILNRSNQRWDLQKKVPKLVLAFREKEFLYSGSTLAPDFGIQDFYYNTLVLNCPYDCEYCYLQGMYSSGHIVMFVNNEDFQNATREALQKSNHLYLCISYDSDLLALEGVFPYCSSWIEFARGEEKLELEIRTKSANISPLLKLTPLDRVVLAWTVTPKVYAEQYEHGTARLHARIKAIAQALSAGWRVRLCFDPIISVNGWEQRYQELIECLGQNIDLPKVAQFALGTFRMPESYFKRTASRRPTSKILAQRYEKQDGVVSLPKEEEDRMKDFVERQLVRQKVLNERIIWC